MRRWLLGFILLLSGCQEPRPPADVDLSAPKPVAVAFLKAIQNADPNAADALSIGTTEQKGWVRSLALMVGGMRAFDKALYARFGPIIDQVHLDMGDSLRILIDQAVTDISEGSVTANEDDARIEPKRHGFASRQVPSIFLRKGPKGWRVDVLKTYAPDTPPGQLAELTHSFDQYRRLGQAFNATANDILAKRFKTEDEAVRALAERLKEVNRVSD